MTHREILTLLVQNRKFTIKPEFEEEYPHIKFVFINDTDSVVYETFEGQCFFLWNLDLNLLNHIELVDDETTLVETKEPENGEQVYLADSFRTFRFRRSSKDHQKLLRENKLFKSKLRANFQSAN